MSLYKPQIKNLIERTLAEINLYSPSAVNLLLGTLAQESLFGKYLRQLNNGPACGFFQMEKPTFDWLKEQFKGKYGVDNITFEDLEWNIKSAIIMCRLRYLIVPETLPTADDVEALAQYWKKYYNTIYGSGTIEEFKKHYKEFVVDGTFT